MKNSNRRAFVKQSIFTAGVLSLPASAWAQGLSSSDEVNVAVVGVGGRGGDHLKGLSEQPNVRIAAICDVDEKILAGAAKRHEKAQTYTDMRKMLENKSIDAVSFATPNHWHALGAIWAVQAGKDVYVEKPVSHNVWEGRKIVEAARKYKKIVQTGTQSRSSSGIKEAVQWVRDGNLGKILVARGLCYKPRQSIGKVEGPQPIPEGLDYDQWCGPALKLPLMRKRLHYDWHWDFNTGNGDLGNQGIHQMDIARWFLGVDQLSPRVFSVGGRLGYIDDGNTPNTQFVFHDYEKAPLIFEVRGLPKGKQFQGAEWNKNMDSFKGASVGVIIHCEGGHVLIPNYNSATAFDKEGKQVKKFEGSSSHYANFVKAVQSRKHTDLNADILEGHLSSGLCHTGNISYQLGKRSRQEQIRESLKNNSEALETFGRMVEHLKSNEVNLESDQITIGPMLKMNPATERFVDNQAANRLLTREYRKPYVVPEKV